MTPITSKEILYPKVKLKANKWTDGLIFVIAMWLFSRIVIVVAMQIIAPIYHISPAHHSDPLPLDFVPGFVPKMSWELFSHWDGAWYRKIATLGYDYANDGQRHSIAFFPLFPLVSRAVMTLGLPFQVAGTLANNLAFLGALSLVYSWVVERHSISGARWVIAVLTWCPFSLFGTVTYTEGLFLLLSTAALRAFDKRQHARAALWGALATATRVNGAAIVPTFLLVAWREKRPATAYVASLVAGIGLLLFSMYCAIWFGDPLAFIHVQQGWQTTPGINWRSWLDIFVQFLTWQPSAVGELTKLVMFFGGGYMLWCLRTELCRIAFVYGFCSLALILTSGSVMSINRFAYGIVSLSIAMGVLLARHPRWGYATISLFAMFLVGLAIRFAWWLWVA